MAGSAQDILAVGISLGLAVGFGWIARRLGLPAVTGYLIAGLVVSPFTPGFVAGRQQLDLLANVGVVLLLFEVGIEIDPVRFGRERRSLVGVALAQTLLTAIAAACATMIFGLNPSGALLIGLATSLSSSVVVVNITRSRNRTTNDETNEALLGWSVVQDIGGVALAIVLLALIGVESRPVWLSLLSFLGYAALALAASWLFPRLLRRLHLERDLFLVYTVATALVLAGLGSEVFGVPVALAAFVAGLAVSEGPDTAVARRRLLPFREVFAVLFFVAIGSLIDPAQVRDSLPWIAILVCVVAAAKVALVYYSSGLIRLEDVDRFQLAVGLGQVGEFGFVLASIGVAARIVPLPVYNALLILVVLTIASSTILVRLSKDTVAAMIRL